jgi:hypothetical protein
VAQDFTQAQAWYRKAAERGVAGAQFNLGMIYVEGAGVERDFVQAYAWFHLAAAQGMEHAAIAKKQLAEALSPEQIAEAETMSRKLVLPQPAAVKPTASKPASTKPPATNPAGSKP